MFINFNEKTPIKVKYLGVPERKTSPKYPFKTTLMFTQCRFTTLNVA